MGNYEYIESEIVQGALRKMGFDGFNVKEHGFNNMGVFDPSNIRSVFDLYEGMLTEMADPAMIRDAAPKALATLKNELPGIDGAHHDFVDEMNIEDDEPKWDEKFAVWKEGYAQRRIGMAIAALNKGMEFRDGKLIVHRMLEVDEEEFYAGIASQGLGEYWTWSKDGASAHGLGGGGNVLITGAVDPKHVDWVQTIHMNAHPNAHDEMEINIPEGTPIKILNLELYGEPVDPSLYGGRGRVLMASLGESQLDDDYARGYNEGQIEGIKAGHAWYEKNMGKADKEPPEFDNFHVQRGRVTKANGYAKAYAYGYQDGYYTMQTGGDAEYLIGKIRAKLGGML